MNCEAVALRWEPSPDRPSALVCYAGKWPVGGVHVDYLRSTHGDGQWEARCLLPGMKSLLERFDQQEEAQERVERAVRHWLQNLIAPGAT